MHSYLTPGRASWRTLQRHGFTLAFAGALAALLPQNAAAQDAGALVDVLVRKGIISSQEGEDVRADMMKDFTQTSAGKINLSPSITKLKLYGDFRYRWQYEDREAQVANPSNVSQRSRHLFRLTLAADIELADHFYAGFALQSGQSSDRALQPYENGFDDYNIFISKAFLGWKPEPWLDVTVGKIKNPFYTTDLVWDPDITPNGLFQQIAFHKMPLFDGAAGPSGKTAVDPKAGSPWELTLVAGQMIFDDNNEFNLDSDLNTDAYLFVEQLIATWKFNKDTSITVAPGFMSFTAADLTGLTRTNAFTDAGDLTFVVPQTQTTVTGRDRVVYAYDAAGALTGATVTRRETTAVQTSQPAATANGLTTQTRVADTRERVTSNTAIGAAAAAARARASGVATNIGAGTAGRTTQTDNDNVSVRTSSTTATGLAAISGETRAMHILTAPGDISFKLGGLKSKLYWDFAYNLSGRERYDDIYQLRSIARPYESRDSLAWLVGLQVGELKKKGDWQIYGNYRESGIASVDPNLNDGDFALGELNMRGFKLGVAYALSDAVVCSVTGYMAWNLDQDLAGGRASNPAQATNPLGGTGIAESNSVNVIQVDLAVKF